MTPVRGMFVQVRAVKGKTYLIKQNEVFELDEVGHYIWECLGGSSLEEIAEKVSSKYQADYGEVLGDVREFVDDLKKNDLIQFE